jgi:pimeloyl-ACP methyl ester carboxylesterase
MRTFSTSRPTWQAVALASDAYAPKASTGSGPLVILHGLYGSKQNWRSLAKAMADRLGKEVIALVRRLLSPSLLVRWS